ncbi:MAG: hypothetical protein ACR2QC_03680 [Gammaproteobacteria bacterium]
MFLRAIPNLAVPENIKNRHSGESRNLFAEGVQTYNYPPLCDGGDSCLRRNGT